MAFQIGDRVVLNLNEFPAYELVAGMTGTVVENSELDCPGVSYDNWHRGHDLYGETVDSGWWTQATKLSLFIEDEEDDLAAILSAMEGIV